MRGRSASIGSIGSLEAGKEADVIAVDPAFVAAVPGASDDDPEDLASRLIFRSHPDMVRAAWVRGRRLEGPGRVTSRRRALVVAGDRLGLCIGQGASGPDGRTASSAARSR